MVNSAWTHEHIANLWWTFIRLQTVYPPCNVAALAALPLDRKLKCLYMVSLAQVPQELFHRRVTHLTVSVYASVEGQQCQGMPLLTSGSMWVAQFRPEKDHAMQLRAFALARQRAASAAAWSGSSEAVLAARLKLIGSCRDDDDERRVEQLVIFRQCYGSHV